MRIRFAAFVCLCAIAEATVASAAEAGRVVDAGTGAPIPGARITIVGQSAAATSGADGRFELDPPPPPFVVVVILPDGRVARPIDIRLAGALDLSVEPAVSEAVTVSGVAPSIDIAPGAAATYLPGADILWRAPATLADALDGMAGVHFVSQGQAAVPSLRGLARGRTLILVDGARAGSERRAGPNASFVDPMSAAGIEVARGFGSVAYGSDAFGGVIAIRTRRPDPSRAFAARVVSSMGAGWPGRRGEVEVSSGYGSGGVSLAVRARELDDYRSPDGGVPNSGWRDRGVRLAWDHETSGGRWSVAWQREAGRDLGRPRSDTHVVRVTGPREDASRLTVSYDTARVGPFRRVVADGLVGAAREVTEQDRRPTAMRPRSVERNDVAYKDAQLRVVGETLAGTTRVETGIDVQARFGLEVSDAVDAYDRDGALAGTSRTTSVESGRSTSMGVFAQASRPIGSRISIDGGVRGERVTSRNAGGHAGDRSTSLAAAAGFGAVTARVTPRLTATAQLARGFRSPTLSDRFSRGPVGRGFFEGNPDLETETSVQLDLGLSLVTGRTRLAASWYRYAMSNLIERYTIEADRLSFRNRPAATLTGFEVEAQAELVPGLLAELAASRVSGRDAGDGTPIDDVPPAMASLTVRYAAPSRWASFVRIARTGAHDDAGPTEVPTPGYTRIDAGVSVRVWRVLLLNVAARNLTDARYYGSAGPRWVYAPGRHGAATLVLTY